MKRSFNINELKLLFFKDFIYRISMLSYLNNRTNRQLTNGEIISEVITEMNSNNILFSRKLTSKLVEFLTDNFFKNSKTIKNYFELEFSNLFHLNVSSVKQLTYIYNLYTLLDNNLLETNFD